MPIMSVRLSDNVQSEWTKLCAERGVNPSTAVREFIEKEVLASEKYGPKSALKTREPKGAQKKVRVSIWLTESEREGIRLRTRLQGGTRAGWIIQAVRAALTKEPGLSDDEVNALSESNYLLRSMGRNLNQMTRRFNATPPSQKPPGFKGVERLTSDIDEHTNKVNQLIRSAAERWVIG